MKLVMFIFVLLLIIVLLSGGRAFASQEFVGPVDTTVYEPCETSTSEGVECETNAEETAEIKHEQLVWESELQAENQTEPLEDSSSIQETPTIGVSTTVHRHHQQVHHARHATSTSRRNQRCSRSRTVSATQRTRNPSSKKGRE
jgi:hypothetical protein